MSIEAKNGSGIADWDTLEPPRVALDVGQAEILGNWSSEAKIAFVEAEDRARRREVIGGSVLALSLQLDPDAFSDALA